MHMNKKIECTRADKGTRGSTDRHTHTPHKPTTPDARMCPRPSSTPVVWFRLGKLRFGFHGTLATLSLILTLYSIVVVYNPTSSTSSSFWIGGLVVVLNGWVAWDAGDSLLDQVPVSTVIVPGYIVAPHREAFQRTMAMMHYANWRIVGREEWLDPQSVLYRAIQLCIWTRFVPHPRTTNWCNGNTWIFVVPMFVAVTMDGVHHQLWHLCPQTASLAVTTRQYLCLHVAALLMAFAFTLAFRGYVSVPKVYLVCSLAVASLFGHIVLTTHRLCN